MGQLKVEAINPVLVTTGAKSFLWLVRGVEWELTCGFCRTRINRIVWMGSTSVICPVCGMRNLLSSAGWLWRRLF